MANHEDEDEKMMRNIGGHCFGEGRRVEGAEHNKQISNGE
jgi:hypothetical protein